MNGEILKNLPDATKSEQFETLCQAAGFRVERIVSAGQCSPDGFWYDQAWDEWVVMLRGGATLQLLEPEETIYLAAGDWIFLPAHRRHRIESCSKEPPSVWLTVHGDAPKE